MSLRLKKSRGFDAGSGERIPTLEETLDFLDKKAKVFVELKESGIEREVLSIVQEKGLEKNVVIVSFLEDALKKTRELNKDIEIGLIYARHKKPLKAALDLKVNYLLALYRFIHTANVEKAHECGFKVIVWTINSLQEAEEFAKKGVDGIASDKPDILIHLKA